MDRSHKSGCPVDPTSQQQSTRRREDLTLGSSQTPPGNERQKTEVETGRTDPSKYYRSPHTGQYSESSHDDPVIQQSFIAAPLKPVLHWCR